MLSSPKSQTLVAEAGLQTFPDMEKNLGFKSQKTWGSDPGSTLSESVDLETVMEILWPSVPHPEKGNNHIQMQNETVYVQDLTYCPTLSEC